MGNSQAECNTKEEIVRLNSRIAELEKQLTKPQAPEVQRRMRRDIENIEKQRNEVRMQSWQMEGSRLDQIVGLEDIRCTLKGCCVLPSKQPQVFKANGGPIEPMRRILLYGPPGTGKTLLAESAAVDSKFEFIRIAMSSVGSKWSYETENNLQVMFDQARACQKGAIVFMDEIDSLGRRRQDQEQDYVRSQKNTLLQLVDKFPDNCIFIAATNKLSELDPALVRRFDLCLYVRLPDDEARCALLDKFLKPHSLTQEELASIAKNTQMFSGAELQNMCNKARTQGLEDWLHCTHWKRDPNQGMKFVPCDENDPTGQKTSIINLPNEMLGNPPQVQKRDILATRALMQPVSTLEEVLKDAPQYIHDILKSKVTEAEAQDKCVSHVDFASIARLVLTQPPEKITALTEYTRAMFPSGVSEEFMKRMLHSFQ